MQVQGKQLGLIQRRGSNGLDTVPGRQVPLAVAEQVAATLHLQSDAAQLLDRHGEVQLNALVAFAPFAIDEAPAIAVCQGFICETPRFARRFGFPRRFGGNFLVCILMMVDFLLW